MTLAGFAIENAEITLEQNIRAIETPDCHTTVDYISHAHLYMQYRAPDPLQPFITRTLMNSFLLEMCKLQAFLVCEDIFYFNFN